VKLTLEKGVEAWGRLEQRFPSFVDLDQVEPGLGGRPSSQFALVPGSADFAHFGFRYTGGQSGLDLRLQTNLISISWNKGFDSKSTPYPRFDALEDNLWWATDVLREALPLPEIRALNMRYGNFVPTDEKGAGTVLQDYFSEATWAPLLKGATQLHGVDFNWREADEIDRRFAISRGESRDGNTAVQGYLVATVAGAMVRPGQSPQTRLSELHDFLQKFFSGLISKRAKEEWKLVE
jgi:uncharacterized protein (TIGR04255 family)